MTFGVDTLWSLLNYIYYVVESNLFLSQDASQEQLFFRHHGEMCSPDPRKHVLVKAKGNPAKYKLLSFIRVMPSDVLIVWEDIAVYVEPGWKQPFLLSQGPYEDTVYLEFHFVTPLTRPAFAVPSLLLCNDSESHLELAMFMSS